MEITPVSSSLNSKLKQQYSGDGPDLIQVGKEGWIFPERYREFGDKYKNFKVRNTDVFVTGYPRSGTSVTADICWLLTHDLDFDAARNSAFNERSKLFELNTLHGSESKLITDENTKKTFKDLLQSLDAEKGRRVIKTHLAFELLPSDLLSCGAKVVYVIRNVKDVAVSYYNLQKTPTRGNFKGTFEDFWASLENDNLTFSPYWKHIKQGLDQSSNKNVLIVFYEEQFADLEKGIKKIADFLEVPLTKKELDDLKEFFTFSNYKKVTQGKTIFNDNFEHVREGVAGAWKKEFPVELSERADKWKAENIKILNLECEELYKYF